MFKRQVLTSILAAATLLGIAPSADASSAAMVGLNYIQIDTGTNFAIIAILGTVSGTRPQCHQSGWNSEYAVDISTTKGKAILALAQAALLSSKLVVVGGSGSTGGCLNTGSASLEVLNKFSIVRNQQQ